MVHNNNSDTSIWYREHWFWFLMAPLVLVVVVSSIFVSVALSGSDDVVSDNYYKEGRMLAQEFVSEEYARSIGLSGSATLDNQSNEMIVKLNQPVEAQSLQAFLSHPVKENLDLRFTLKKFHELSFRADVPSTLHGRWYIRVTAVDESPKTKEEKKPDMYVSNELWRLVGEINLEHQSSVNLQ